MESILFIGLIGAFIAIIVDLLQNLPTTESHKIRKWLIGWFIKGAIVPIIAWTLFNLGVFQKLPDFVSARLLEKMGGSHRDATLLLIFVGVIVITSYWMAITSGWLVAVVAEYDEHGSEIFKRTRWLAILLSPLAILFVTSFGWGAVGIAGTLWLLPIVKAASTVAAEPVRRLRPSYSKAAIHVQRGKYEDAEQEVIAELEKCEDDFDGWMLLADLYANHFRDLPAAARMIEETCDQPTTTVSEVAVAYHRLADWYLKLENDPESAIKALKQIARRYPTTHVDRMAHLRIQKINGEEAHKKIQPRIVPLHSLSTEAEVTAGQPDLEAAAAKARRCSEMLKKNPNDITARETFARLLAEQFGKPDLAIEQLELLLDLGESDESARARIPEWLSLTAAWRLKFLNDEEGAVTTIKRLIQNHPSTGQAFAAQRRLHMIEMERRLRTNRALRPVPDSSTA